MKTVTISLIISLILFWIMLTILGYLQEQSDKFESGEPYQKKDLWLKALKEIFTTKDGWVISILGWIYTFISFWIIRFFTLF